jgi:hypothetical protein
MCREPDSKRLEPKHGLEVVKKNDGTFDIFLNRELDHENIPEAWLPEQLRVRSDSAVREYDSSLREVNQNGRATIVF